jgi:colanic acid/amylovoran biosynthesis glycosyltransferase
VTVGYVVSGYPAVSHTFITREVQALRRLGVQVRTFSIRATPPTQLLSEEDRQEMAVTTAILPIAPPSLARVHLQAFLQRPISYLRTLASAVRLGEPTPRATLWRIFYFAEAIVLWSHCRRSGIRHLHAHFANVASWVSMLAAEFGVEDGFTWSFTMHGPTEFANVEAFALEQKVIDARFVACISDFCRSQLMRIVSPDAWHKIVEVPCGLRFGAVTTSSVVDDGSDRAIHVLCVGRLVPDKGQELLIDAVAGLRDAGHDIHVTLIGDGPDRERLEHRARKLDSSSAIAFTGSLPQLELVTYLARADIFCLPSFAEGLPVAIMEAMALGVPVISTRIAGIPELIIDGENGRLISPGRVDLLQAAILELATTPSLRESWGRRGRETVRARHDVDESARLLRALFSDAAGA